MRRTKTRSRTGGWKDGNDRRRDSDGNEPADRRTTTDRDRSPLHRSTRDVPNAAPRKTPTAAQPTPTKARLPPMLHLPCLLTESD